MAVEKMTTPPSERGVSLRKRRAILILLSAVLCGILFLLLLPEILKQGLVSSLKSPTRGDVVVEDIDFNPFTGTFLLKGVELRDTKGEGGSFGKAGLRIDWLPLFDRRLQVTDLRVESGNLNLSQRGDEWLVASFSTAGSTQEEAPDGEGWQWRVESIELRDVILHYRDSRLSEEIKIDRLDVERLGNIETEKVCRFDLSAKLRDATLDLKGEGRFFSESPNLKGDATLRSFPLEILEPYVKSESLRALAGAGEGEAKITASFPAEGPAQFEIDGSASVKDGRAEFPFGVLQTPEVRWSGSMIWRGGGEDEEGGLGMKGALTGRGADFVSDDTVLHFFLESLKFDGALDIREEVTISGTVGTKGLRIDDTARGLNLFASAQLDADGFALSDDVIALKSIDSSGVRMLESFRKGNASHIFELERLHVSDTRYRAPRRLEIGDIEISGGVGRIERDAKGDLDLIEWFKTPGKEKESSPQAGTTLLLKGVRFTGDNSLLVRDETLRPPYTERLTLLSGEIGSFDSAEPARPSPVSLHLRIGKYGDLELSGSLTPFAVDESMNFKGKMTAFDLPSVAAYARRNIDYEIRQGHLDAEIDWTVQKGAIDSKISIVAGKLQIEPVTKNGSKRFEQILGLPVQTTLSLLRDGDDNIRLRLLLDGKFSDPNFSVRDLVTRATRAAVQKAAFSYFAPMGVTLLTGVALPPGTLFVAGKVVDWAMTMRFEPVLFEPGETEIGPEGSDYLDTMAQLLADRPKVRVVLCGKTSWSDLGREGDREKTPLSEAEAERLVELAGERATGVKDALIDRGIDIGRILICSPVAEPDSSGPPRVEISL